MRLARQPPLMAVCWEQEQPDGKAVTSSTSEVVSEITINREVMQIPPAPEESGYQNVAALVGSSATLPELACGQLANGNGRVARDSEIVVSRRRS